MPYNPGNWNVYSQGLASLSQGVASGSAAMGQAVKDYTDRKRLTQSLRTMFETVDPENKDMYGSMGLSELQGKLQSYSMQYTIGRLKQQQQELQQEEAIGEALRRYGEGPPPPADTSADFGGDLGQGATPAAPPASARFTMAGIPTPFGPPVMVPVPAAPEESPAMGEQIKAYAPTQEDRIRYALQTPRLGGTGAVKLMNALNAYQSMKPQGVNLPLGASLPVGDIGHLVGTGNGNQFVVNPRAATAKAGLLGVGEVKPAGNYGVIVGTGDDNQFVANPNTTSKASMTDAQSNSLTYSRRMAEADSQLSALMKARNLDPTSFSGAVQTSDLAQNWARWATSKDWNNYVDTQNNWISAVLRKESGSAISKTEYKGARMEYFPQYNDSKDAIERKARLRALVQESIRQGAGPFAKEKVTDEDFVTFAKENQAAVAPKYDTEDQARSSGAKTGDVVVLYDPATATYRKARLK